MHQESKLMKLQQKLDQTRRLAAVAPDPTTKERLAQMVEELTEKLRTIRGSGTGSVGGPAIAAPIKPAAAS